MPTFVDYGPSHPEFQEFDPRTMKIAPKIKYTAEEEWLVAKGEAPKRKKELKEGEENTPNSVQLEELAKMLIATSAWKGENFSRGDKQVAKYAVGEGPHDALTYVEAGFAHHLTLVVRQLASLAET
jgi:hypothetical protein